MFKKSWVKKRDSESPEAKKAQQRYRRKKTLFRKAAQYHVEFESDVVVVIRSRKSGQIRFFDSSSHTQWLNRLWDLTSYYPKPIQETVEDIIPQSRGRLLDQKSPPGSTGDVKA